MSVYSLEKDITTVGVFNIAIGVTALAMPPLGAANVAYTGGFRTGIPLTVAAVIVGIWTTAVGTAGPELTDVSR